MNQHRQKGVALIVALILLVLITMIGLASIRGSGLQEVMAGNMRDNQVSFQAAEAGLRLGEAAVSKSNPPTLGTGIVEELTGAADADFWKAYSWASGSIAPAIDLKIEAADPQYVLEKLDVEYIPGSDGRAVDWVQDQNKPEIAVYRVTSRGVGLTDSAVTILQTTFRRQ